MSRTAGVQLCYDISYIILVYEVLSRNMDKPCYLCIFPDVSFVPLLLLRKYETLEWKTYQMKKKNTFRF